MKITIVIMYFLNEKIGCDILKIQCYGNYIEVENL